MQTSENSKIISGRNLKNESLIIDGERLVSIVDCQLEKCNIAIDSLDGADGLLDCGLDDCTITINNKRKRSVFLGSDFTGCSFKGVVRNGDFGRSRADHPVFEKFNRRGSVVDCDFTQAMLEMCRFFEVDLNRQKFPPWPQFVVPHERELLAEKLQRVWPGKIKLYLTVAAQERASLSGLAGTLSYFMKNYSVTEEELVQVLVDIGGVFR